MPVTNLAELETLIQQVKAAQAEYATFTQEQVDRIFHKAALAANSERIPLAKLAVQETGMSIVEDKVIKNHFASEYITNTRRPAGSSSGMRVLATRELLSRWGSWQVLCR